VSVQVQEADPPGSDLNVGQEMVLSSQPQQQQQQQQQQEQQQATTQASAQSLHLLCSTGGNHIQVSCIIFFLVQSICISPISISVFYLPFFLFDFLSFVFNCHVLYSSVKINQ
jgi:hypothetical protein